MAEDIVKCHEGKLSMKHSELGIISITFGLLGLLTSCIILYILSQIVGSGFHDNEYMMRNLLNILDKVEIYIKIIGILTAIIGVIQRGRRKIMPIIGVVINTISISLTICTIYGVF